MMILLFPLPIGAMPDSTSSKVAIVGVCLSRVDAGRIAAPAVLTG